MMASNAELRKRLSPKEAIKKIYLDSITHDEHMLLKLVDMVGADKICLGSDYPFPLGEVGSLAPGTGEVLDTYPGHMLETMDGLSIDDRAAIMYKTGLRWLGVGEQDLVKHRGGYDFRCCDRFAYME